MSEITWQDEAAEERAVAWECGSACSCAACGAALSGGYCAACGQERLPPDDLRLSHFTRRAAEEVFDLDSRLLRTLRMLVTRPGELTREFVAGRRKCYFGPFKLFLGISLVYFVLVWPVAMQLEGGALRTLNQLAVVQELARAKGIDGAELARRFQEGFQRNIKLLTDFVSVPLLALFVAAIYRRTRRRFAEHLVFALHYTAFHYLVSTAVVGALLAVGWAYGVQARAPAFLVTYVAVIPYAFFATRRVYGVPGSTSRTLLFIASEYLIHILVAALAFLSALYFA